jgi:uncharacterized protein (TIGR00369 family)
MTHVAAARRSPEEQRLLEAALKDLFEHKVTFNQTLGMRMVSLAPPAPSARLEMRPDLIGHYLYGRLHGGVISAVLDAMGGVAVMVGITEKHCDEAADVVMHRFSRLGTIDLRVDYLRPGIGEHFIASAEVTRLGGRVASTQMRLVNQDGTLIATGAAAYIVS